MQFKNIIEELHKAEGNFFCLAIPFGKHRGQSVADLPTSYLAWLLEECDLKNNNLKEEIRNTLYFRMKVLNVIPDALPDVKNVYRKLSMKYHPDRGGSVAAMQAINDFKDALQG